MYVFFYTKLYTNSNCPVYEIKMSDPKFRLEKMIFVASVRVHCTPKAHSLRKIESEDVYIFQVFGFIFTT